MNRSSSFSYLGARYRSSSASAASNRVAASSNAARTNGVSPRSILTHVATRGARTSSSHFTHASTCSRGAYIGYVPVLASAFAHVVAPATSPPGTPRRMGASAGSIAPS
eukprot:14353-Pelagococcus_subviridis.AAC.8